MNLHSVTLRGISPLHLHCHSQVHSSTSHRCLVVDGRPTIDAFDILAAVEQAAHPVADGCLSLLLAIFVEITEPRVAIASRGVRQSVIGHVDERTHEWLYEGVTFDDWSLQFTVETPEKSRYADECRHALEIAGRDIGLGYQIAGVDLGRFVVQEFSPVTRDAGCQDAALECAR